MNLLMVCAYLPSLNSAAGERNYHLLRALAQRHTISLLSLVDSAEVDAHDVRPQLEDLAYSVRLIPLEIPHFKRWHQLLSIGRGRSYLLNKLALNEVQSDLNKRLGCDHFDAVFFESVLVAGYQLPAGMKVIIDQHNIEHELLRLTYEQEKTWLRKWYNWYEYRLVKQAEIERCRKADLVLVTSERERQILKGLLPENLIEVVRTGIDIEAFSENCAEQEAPHQVIFTGTMNYYPNTNAVLFFAQQCWPLIRAKVPDASWQIVGRNPPPEVRRLAELPGVTVKGSVPDVRPYLASSAVAIAPLQIGSGTRVKILEAFAMGKAVVSTSIGYQGLGVEPGKHLLLADQPEAFAQAVVELLHNPSMRIALGKAGRSLVEAEYSWEQARTRLQHILDDFNNGAELAMTHAAVTDKKRQRPSSSVG
jgi:sugar transferase (PEP-CTERM/EpsH1 system associated)